LNVILDHKERRKFKGGGIMAEVMTDKLAGCDKLGECNNIIGYYETPNLIRPVFDRMSKEEFNLRYPGKEPVLESHLADDDDYVRDRDDECFEWD
jgi:hypothetical protein